MAYRAITDVILPRPLLASFTFKPSVSRSTVWYGPLPVTRMQLLEHIRQIISQTQVTVGAFVNHIQPRSRASRWKFVYFGCVRTSLYTFPHSELQLVFKVVTAMVVKGIEFPNMTSAKTYMSTLLVTCNQKGTFPMVLWMTLLLAIIAKITLHSRMSWSPWLPLVTANLTRYDWYVLPYRYLGRLRGTVLCWLVPNNQHTSWTITVSNSFLWSEWRVTGQLHRHIQVVSMDSVTVTANLLIRGVYTTCFRRKSYITNTYVWLFIMA